MAEKKRIIESILDRFINKDKTVIVPDDFLCQHVAKYCEDRGIPYVEARIDQLGDFIDITDYAIYFAETSSEQSTLNHYRQGMKNLGKMTVVLEINS